MKRKCLKLDLAGNKITHIGMSILARALRKNKVGVVIFCTICYSFRELLNTAGLEIH
jgi:hypothetical protein